LPCDGETLYKWARDIELSVGETVDSFIPEPDKQVEGHETLFALSLLEPGCLQVDKVPVAGRSIAMLDDAHKLTTAQQSKLKDAVVQYRPQVGVWVAQRLEALSPVELLALGAGEGRDYGAPIDLEEFWRASPKRFEKTVLDIADRRARNAQDVVLSSFVTHLEDSLDGTEWQDQYLKAAEVVSARLKSKEGGGRRYLEWIADREGGQGTARERAAAWRALEILVQRDYVGAQQVLEVEVPLTREDLASKDSAPVRAAAELLLAKEFGLPYYCGPSRIAALSNSNIDQFLSLAGELFEEIIAAELLRKPSRIRPDRQETILRRVAKQRWDELPRRVANGRIVQKLLHSICELALWEWNKGTASYGAGGGVTGIGITMRDRERLVSSLGKTEGKKYDQLVMALTSCISNGLLQVSLDRPQGEKGKTWMLLYLNRWLCLHFGLPLQLGGWRPVSPDELARWISEGFKPGRRGRR